MIYERSGLFRVYGADCLHKIYLLGSIPCKCECKCRQGLPDGGQANLCRALAASVVCIRWHSNQPQTIPSRRAGEHHRLHLYCPSIRTTTILSASKSP